MSVQGAKIIDLEERRRARQLTAASLDQQSVSFMPPFAMAWVPVWFVPVMMADPLPLAE